MSWQIGTVVFGFGLALFSLVAPMMGLVLPRGLLALLLGISVLLMLLWPASAILTVMPQRNRILTNGLIGCIIGGVTFMLMAYMVPDRPCDMGTINKVRRDALHVVTELRRLQDKIEMERVRSDEHRDRAYSKGKGEEEREAIWREWMHEERILHSRHTADFNLIRSRAIVARDAMLKCLPEYVKDGSDQMADDTLANGMLAGVHPVRGAANYLEKLALSLPED